MMYSPKVPRSKQQQASTPRKALKELSTNIYQSSPDLPRNLDFISFDNGGDPSLSLGLDLSYVSQGENCSCEDSSALEHSDYRRRADAEGRDSRVFDDEYETPQPPSNEYTGVTVELNQHKRKTHIGPWQLGKTLGIGASGSVRLVRHIETNELGAVKIMSKQRNDQVSVGDDLVQSKEKWTNSMEREVIIMKMVRHPNVVRMYDVWEGRHELYLVLEYVDGGDLFDYMMNRGCLGESEAVSLFVQILKGVEYCHYFSICHRDLKLENILLDKNYRVKIADFGFAALQPPGWKLARSCGTPHYAAPEVINGGEYNGPPTDIWSCGIILYALLCGCVPFDDEDHTVVLKKVKAGKFKMPKHLSREAQDLISRILNIDPEERITMEQIWGHPLITKYLDQSEIAARKEHSGYKTAERPVECAEEIDRAILENMRGLWPCVKDLEVLKAALLNPEPNQEKVFYSLLERYKDDNCEYFCSKLTPQQTSPKKSPSKKSPLKTKAYGARFVGQSGTSNKVEGSNYAETSIQHLEQILEHEEVHHASNLLLKQGFGDNEDDEDGWQDYDIRDDNGDESDVSNNIVNFLEDLDFSTPTEVHPHSTSPRKAVRVNLQRKRSRPKSWVSVTSRKKGVVFNRWAVGNLRTRDTTLVGDSVYEDQLLSARSSTPGTPPPLQSKVIGRKEGMAAKAKRQLSISSSYSGTVIQTALLVPVRRRAVLRTEDDDVRKASRELSEYCEAVFKTRNTPIEVNIPPPLPSFSVLSSDKVMPVMEGSGLTPTRERISSHIRLPVVEPVPYYRHEQRETYRMDNGLQERRIMSVPTPSIQIQREHDTSSMSFLNAPPGPLPESTVPSPAFPYSSNSSQRINRAAYTSLGSPSSASQESGGASHRVGSAYVEHYRQEANRIDLFENNYDDINTSTKRNIFRRIGGKIFNNKTQEPVDVDGTNKTRGFWAAIGARIGSNGTNTTRKGRRKYSRLRDSEVRKGKEIAHTSNHSFSNCHGRGEDSDDNAQSVQYDKPKWFKRALRLKPASYIVCFQTNTMATRREILQILGEWNWKGLGLIDIKTRERNAVITARVAKRNALNVRPVSFMIQIRSYGPSEAEGRSVVRFLQKKGAASSLRRLVHELVKACRRGGVLVEDALEISHMESAFDTLES